MEGNEGEGRARVKEEVGNQGRSVTKETNGAETEMKTYRGIRYGNDS